MSVSMMILVREAGVLDCASSDGVAERDKPNAAAAARNVRTTAVGAAGSVIGLSASEEHRGRNGIKSDR